ncbi:hypothetical protein KCU98_g3648, partial [Aureobasidium melanogenum]
MRMSRNLQDGGPGRQGLGSGYRQPPPPGYTRNLQDGGPGRQGQGNGYRTRNLHAEYNGPTAAQCAEYMRQMQEQEYRRQMRAEAEAIHRQQMREEREYRERERREEEMRRREHAMYRGGQQGRGGYSGGGRGGGPGPRFRSKNLQTGPAYMASLEEQETIRQYRGNNQRRGGPGGGCTVM